MRHRYGLFFPQCIKLKNMRIIRNRSHFADTERKCWCETSAFHPGVYILCYTLIFSPSLLAWYSKWQETSKELILGSCFRLVWSMSLFCNCSGTVYNLCLALLQTWTARMAIRRRMAGANRWSTVSTVTCPSQTRLRVSTMKRSIIWILDIKN